MRPSDDDTDRSTSGEGVNRHTIVVNDTDVNLQQTGIVTLRLDAF